MEIYEKINLIIKEKKITKRKFSNMLRDLEPKLKSTGETPTEKTIYKYLSGDINIPIEILSFIAEALNITEQELFDTTSSTKVKLFKYISKGLDDNQIEYLNDLTTNSNIVKDVSVQYGKKNTKGLAFNNEEKLEKLISLLEFAPNPLVDKIINRLEDIKGLALKDI